MTLKTKIKVRIKPLNVKLTKEIKHIGERIIIPHLAKAIQEGKDISGKKYAELDSKTIKRKGHSDPLIGEDRLLFRSFRFKNKGKGKAVLYIDKIRAKIANILQNEGVKTRKGKRRFEFFAINDEMEQEAHEYIRDRIGELINAR